MIRSGGTTPRSTDQRASDDRSPQGMDPKRSTLHHQPAHTGSTNDRHFSWSPAHQYTYTIRLTIRGYSGTTMVRLRTRCIQRHGSADRRRRRAGNVRDRIDFEIARWWIPAAFLAAGGWGRLGWNDVYQEPPNRCLLAHGDHVVMPTFTMHPKEVERWQVHPRRPGGSSVVMVVQRAAGPSRSTRSAAWRKAARSSTPAIEVTHMAA